MAPIRYYFGRSAPNQDQAERFTRVLPPERYGTALQYFTGSKDHNDIWHIDGAELARVFPVTPANAQPTPLDTHPDALAAYKMVLAEERIAELKGRLEEMRQERDRARTGEDAWKAQCEAVTRQIALPAPHDAQTAHQCPDTQPPRYHRAPRWMRSYRRSSPAPRFG